MTDVTERRGGRPKAREIVMRALFEAEISNDNVGDVFELSLGRFRFTEDGRDYAAKLISYCENEAGRIEEVIVKSLQNWDFSRLGVIERSILRLSVAELLFCPAVPKEVIIDESLRLAHRYGEDETAGFINGVLDSVARIEREKREH